MRSSQSPEWKDSDHYGKGYPVWSWGRVCPFALLRKSFRIGIDASIGPAHAVYFATYESVKHAMGGNSGKAEHHPLAAGE